MLPVAVAATEGTGSGANPWLVVGVALIAATAALLGAVIAARTAGTRQKEQLAHEERRQTKALDAEERRQAQFLREERGRLDARLEHERALADVADLRRVAESLLSSTNAVWFSSLELFGSDPREEVVTRLKEATLDMERALDAVYVRLPLDHALVAKTSDVFNSVRRVSSAALAGEREQFDSSTAEHNAALVRFRRTAVAAIGSRLTQAS